MSLPALGVPRSLRAVSLDLWGTLIRSDPRFKPARTRLLADAMGVPTARLEDADRLFRNVDRAADDVAQTRGVDVGFAERVQAMSSAVHDGGLDGPLTAVSVADLLSGCAVTPPLQDAVVGQLHAAQDDLVRTYPPRPHSEDLPQKLMSLGAVLPLAIASNTGMLGGATMRTALAANGLLPAFRVAVFSNEIGASKPAARFFASVFHGLAAVTAGAPLDPAQVAHLGDDARADVHGAKAAGMLAMRVNVGTTAADAAPVLPVDAALDRLLRAAS